MVLLEARPLAAERLVARTPGKETLPFRSYGIPGEWRPEPSRLGGAAGRETEARCRREPGLSRGLGRGAGVRAQPDEKGPIGMSKVPGRGRRERWNEKSPVSVEVPGPGTLCGPEQRRRSLTRAGKVPGMEGAGAPALGGASGHLDDTQGYSGGGREGGPTRAAQ